MFIQQKDDQTTMVYASMHFQLVKIDHSYMNPGVSGNSLKGGTLEHLKQHAVSVLLQPFIAVAGFIRQSSILRYTGATKKFFQW